MRELTDQELDCVAGGTEESEPEIIVTGTRPGGTDISYINPDVERVSTAGVGR